MINFGNGRKISSVVVSTAMGISGAGMFPYNLLISYRMLMNLVRNKGITVITKSSTLEEQKGNFNLLDPRSWKYIQRISDGTSMLNAHGLTNKGVECNACKNSKACDLGFKVIPSFHPDFNQGLNFAIFQVQSAIMNYQKQMKEKFWALELNVSCPNFGETVAQNEKEVVLLVEKIKKINPNLVLIIKTSIEHTLGFYQELESAGADAVHAINSIPFNVVFPDKISPVAHVGGGGLSGAWAFSSAREYLSMVAMVTELPIIFGCGVSNIDQARSFFSLRENGKTAVSICSVFLRNPMMARKIIALKK